jgi:hypothetical protein
VSEPDTGASGPTEAADAVRRWEQGGAVWRVLARSGAPAATVTVGLFTCDGGEEVGRVTATAAELAAVLRGRESSED